MAFRFAAKVSVNLSAEKFVRSNKEDNKMKYANFETMPIVLSVDDIADTLAIGRNKAYGLVNSGTIKALKIGQHYRIPRDEFIKFIKSCVQSA